MIHLDAEFFLHARFEVISHNFLEFFDPIYFRLYHFKFVTVKAYVFINALLLFLKNLNVLSNIL